MTKLLSFEIERWHLKGLSKVKETIVAKKSGGHRICFNTIPLFVLKIVLADTGYIEVQYTKSKSDQIECACHSPKPRCSAPGPRA